MSQSKLWDDVDDYFTTHLAPEDDVLRAALRDSEAAGLPSIAVTAPQGKLLQLLAQIQGSRTILELQGAADPAGRPRLRRLAAVRQGRLLLWRRPHPQVRLRGRDQGDPLDRWRAARSGRSVQAGRPADLLQ